MSKSMKKDNISQILFNIIMLMFFGILFVTGTFFDEEIARTVFSPGNTVIAVITSTGLIPYFSAPMLFSGALYETLYNMRSFRGGHRIYRRRFHMRQELLRNAVSVYQQKYPGDPHCQCGA